MWDPPGPGLEPVSPVLAGGFLTTAPPGKPRFFILKDNCGYSAENRLDSQGQSQEVSEAAWTRGRNSEKWPDSELQIYYEGRTDRI